MEFFPPVTGVTRPGFGVWHSLQTSQSLPSSPPPMGREVGHSGHSGQNGSLTFTRFCPTQLSGSRAKFSSSLQKTNQSPPTTVQWGPHPLPSWGEGRPTANLPLISMIPSPPNFCNTEQWNILEVRPLHICKESENTFYCLIFDDVTLPGPRDSFPGGRGWHTHSCWLC